MEWDYILDHTTGIEWEEEWPYIYGREQLPIQYSINKVVDLRWLEGLEGFERFAFQVWRLDTYHLLPSALSF